VLPALREALGGGPALFVGAEPSVRQAPELASLSDRRLDLPETVEQRVALVVETSGSTGRPKRVMLSADAVLASAAASESALGGPGQWVLALPTNYIAGLNVLARSIAAGFDPVMIEGHFDAASFVTATDALTEKVRFTALVPAQLATLLEDQQATARLREFDRVLVGGQSTPAGLRERAAEAGIRITRTYGSSETSGGCVYDGEPIGQTTVRIEDGEVWLGGPTLAEGYLGDPALTAERFVVADGTHWFRTADAGAWDGERLQVSGRRDDVIISGGVKVSLGAVERVLVAAGLTDAVVVAAADARWGEVPLVFTARAADETPLLAAVERELGRPARPARIVRVEALPLLASGKPDRRALATDGQPD
jgi:O-succinylbenzoic acid--CoA ligase